MSLSKCYFFQKELNFLGHQISENGIEPCPKKTEAIQEWPKPQNVRQLRSWLGLCGYYRKMIAHSATIAKPLHKLTEAYTPFVWDDAAEKSLLELKAKLCSAPILAFPSESLPSILHTDASNVAASAVISQIQDNTETVIGYFSKCFFQEVNATTVRQEKKCMPLS